MSTSSKGKYERLEQRAARGKFDLVVPFDYLIMEHLPEVGSLFAGMYPLGETVANIQKTLNEGMKGAKINTGDVYGRIRSLEVQGLVAQTNGRRSQRVWQRTTRGTKLFKDWKESQGGATTGK